MLDSANNLSELQLTLGKLAEAITLAEQGVDHAHRGEDAFLRYALAHDHCLAGAQHQAGKRARAETLFQEAEQFQAEFPAPIPAAPFP